MTRIIHITQEAWDKLPEKVKAKYGHKRPCDKLRESLQRKGIIK